MKLPSLRSFAFALIVAAAASLPGIASAQTPAVIDHLPYMISAPGLYVLNNNLSSTQNGQPLIDVSANNVTIDFQGHYIAGSSADPNQVTYGIQANEKSNLTVRNGTIAFCGNGIYVVGGGTANTNSVNFQCENMRMTYCGYYGIQVANTPGSRIVNCSLSQSPNGIYTFGAGVLVQGNVLIGTVTNNTTGISASTTGSFMRQNVISNFATGILGGKYQDNLTSGCTTPFSGGTDAGGNN